MARNTLGQIQRNLYLTQRAIGDYRAAERGPGVYAKRILRRHITRHVGQSYNRLWKKI